MMSFDALSIYLAESDRLLELMRKINLDKNIEVLRCVHLLANPVRIGSKFEVIDVISYVERKLLSLPSNYNDDEYVKAEPIITAIEPLRRGFMHTIFDLKRKADLFKTANCRDDSQFFAVLCTGYELGDADISTLADNGIIHLHVNADELSAFMAKRGS